MTRIMQLELPDEVYDALAQLAHGSGQSPEQMVGEWITSAANTIAAVSTRSPRSRTKRSSTGPNTPDPARSDAAHTRSSPRETLAEAIYELKITLLGSKPAIWRRVQVPGEITLIKLHRTMQALMGWQDYHLHQLTVNGAIYGMRVEDWQDATPEMLDERGVRLYRIAPVAGTRLLYEYDLGDGWQLEIIVEAIRPAQEGASLVVCLDGRRAGPPEDVGGIGGYEEFVKAIRNRRHPEHASWLRWVGGSFDPERFAIDAVNRPLKRIR